MKINFIALHFCALEYWGNYFVYPSPHHYRLKNKIPIVSRKKKLYTFGKHVFHHNVPSMITKTFRGFQGLQTLRPRHAPPLDLILISGHWTQLHICFHRKSQIFVNAKSHTEIIFRTRNTPITCTCISPVSIGFLYSLSIHVQFESWIIIIIIITLPYYPYVIRP